MPTCLGANVFLNRMRRLPRPATGLALGGMVAGGVGRGRGGAGEEAGACVGKGWGEGGDRNGMGKGGSVNTHGRRHTRSQVTCM